MEVPQNPKMDVLWFKKNIEMDDLGVPPFMETLKLNLV